MNNTINIKDLEITNKIDNTDYFLIEKEDGTKRISGRIINDIDSQLDNKANLTSIFSMANMGQDVKEAMTGGSVAVVGKDTVLVENIVNKQIISEKTNFLERIDNLFIPETIIKNKYLNDSGIVEDNNNGFDVSDFIPVKQNEKYTAIDNQYSYYYDSSFNKIGKIMSPNFTTPTNCCYVRFTIQRNLFSNFVLLEGIQSITENNKYSKYVFKDLKIVDENLNNKSIDIDKLSFATIIENLITTSMFKLNYSIDTNTGNETPRSGDANLPYIEVISGNKYFINFTHYIYFYRADKTFIKFDLSNVNVRIIPTDCKYIRVVMPSYTNEKINTACINLGDKLFSDFTQKKYISKDFLEIEEQTTWKNKKMVTFGDSITQEGTWQPYIVEKLGVNFLKNCGVGGSAVCDHSVGMCSDTRINDIPTDTELLLFMGGSNDWGMNMSLGNIESTVSYEFYGALKIMFDKLYTRLPNARIIVLEMPFRKDMYANEKNFVLEDYREALREVAYLYGYPIIKLKTECGVNQLNANTYLKDSVHPNEIGGKRIAEVIIGELKRLQYI